MLALSRRSVALLTLLCLLPLLASSRAWGQGYDAEKPMGATAQQLPGYLAHAGIEQRLGQSLPLSSSYTDETGKTAVLSSWLQDGKPAIVALIYYRCAMLCPQVMHGLATGLRGTTLHAGKDFNVLVFSIDPMDTPHDAAVQKGQFLRDAGIDAGGASDVHFFTGKQASIDAVAGATGFHYVAVPGPDGKMDQFAHSSVIMFATPEGRLSKYIAGIDYAPRDLRLALLGAGEHRISNPVDLLILYCCSYNPVVGRYSVSVLRVLSIAGMVALAMVAGMIFLLTRKPRAHAAG